MSVDWSLEWDDYNDCCGVVIIHSFPTYSDSFYIDPFDPDNTSCDWNDLSSKQKECLKITLKKEVTRVVSRNPYKGMFQVVLESWQNTRFSKVLKDCDFKCKQTFINPNTSSKLFLYTLLSRQPKKDRVKRKFGRGERNA